MLVTKSLKRVLNCCTTSSGTTGDHKGPPSHSTLCSLASTATTLRVYCYAVSSAARTTLAPTGTVFPPKEWRVRVKHPCLLLCYMIHYYRTKPIFSETPQRL